MNNNTLYIKPYHILMMNENKERKLTKEQKMKQTFIIKKSKNQRLI
jgi:hypothetical protein